MITPRELIKRAQEKFESILPVVRRELARIESVVFVGIGAKETKGEITEELCFRVYVKEKKSGDLLAKGELVPQEVFGFRTDVIQMGEIIKCSPLDDNRYRPLVGGVMVRNDKFGNSKSHSKTRGIATLGCLATRSADNAIVGLGAAHNFLAAQSIINDTHLGQPRYVEICCCGCFNDIGVVTNAVDDGDLDCAIVEIREKLADKITNAGTVNSIQDINNITGVSGVVCFDTVRKRGAATQVTTGVIVDIAYDGNRLLINPVPGTIGGKFADFGDSGAVIVDNTDKVIGLLIGAERGNSNQRGVANKIKPVMQAMGIKIAGQDHTAIFDTIGNCEWKAWPGGQVDTALNPQELITIADLGFAGPIDWDVSLGGISAEIIEKDGVPGSYGTTALNASSIGIRYDINSPTSAISDAVRIRGKNNATNTVSDLLRTVFKVTPRVVNHSAALDADNTLLFPATAGTATSTAGVATPGVGGATFFQGKAEIVWDVLPANIQWSTIGVNYVYRKPGEVPQATNAKFELTSRRDHDFTEGLQSSADANRTHQILPWAETALAAASDFQIPTDAKPNEIFRLASPGFDPATLKQKYLRSDYRDYLEFHNGTSWVRITPYAPWFLNLTAGLSGGGVPPPVTVAPNTIGVGTTGQTIPNAPPAIVTTTDLFVPQSGNGISLTAAVTDANNDVFNVQWSQTSGTPVVLSGGGAGLSTTFTAPVALGDLQFTVTANDSTQGLARSAGNHSASTVVTVHVVSWQNVGGGHVNNSRNKVETFNSNDFFGIVTPVNWDVATGGTAGVIVEKDGVPGAYGTSVVGATTIKVRYDTFSASNNFPDAVIIQATNGASINKKFRSVYRITVAVHATDLHTHLIPSTMPATGLDHFCSAQGQGDTILDATITPAPAAGLITWHGTGIYAFTVPAIGADTTTARISSNTGTGQEIPFDIRISGHSCYQGKFWTIWSTAAPVIIPAAPVIYNINPGMNGFSRTITITFTIQPATIISATPAAVDIPDLRGANTSIAGPVVPPPDVPGGDVGVQNSGAGVLAGGATTKWDVSRQNKQKPANIANIPLTIAQPGALEFYTLYNNYPTLSACGNDDKGVADEDNDPYTVGFAPIGAILAQDAPTRIILDADGAVGDTFELRLHFREFARVLLDTNWYRISNYQLWRIHHRGIKADESVDGTDYDGDGNQTDVFWIDNGTTIALDNAGF